MTEQLEHRVVAAEHQTGSTQTRRAVLLGAGALGAAGLLAACGDGTGTPIATTSGSGTAGPANTGTATPTGTGTPTHAASPTGRTSPAGATTKTGAGGGIKAAQIPVGGGTIFKDQNFVITQPTAGNFKAFDATCQHMGCQVGTVVDGKINCLCHGSQYNIADGSVAQGPSASPLPPKKVTVSGDTLTVS